MLTVKPCLRSRIARKMRGLASLLPVLALALLLTLLLSSEKALSFFQSPTSPLPTMEEVPPSTEVPTPTLVGPTASPSPTDEASSTEMPAPTQVRSTSTPPSSEVPPTVTATVHPDEEPSEPTPASTQAALLPALEAAPRPTEPASAEMPVRGGPRLWPWILLGALSIGAIAAGVFLLQREAPAEEE